MCRQNRARHREAAAGRWGHTWQVVEVRAQPVHSGSRAEFLIMAGTAYSGALCLLTPPFEVILPTPFDSWLFSLLPMRCFLSSPQRSTAPPRAPAAPPAASLCQRPGGCGTPSPSCGHPDQWGVLGGEAESAGSHPFISADGNWPH